MRILITGGTGLIGSRLIPVLFDHHKIVAITRNVAMAEHVLSHKVELHSTLDHFSDLDDFDAVINLAGEPIADGRWSETKKREIENSRWEMTRKLVDLCKAGKRPPSAFISGSAVGYYGRQGPEPIDEDFEQPNDEFSHQLCKKWEDIAFEAQSTSTRVCVVRTGIVLAKKGGALARMIPPFKCGLGGPMGDGKQFMSWIHIHDVIAALDYLLVHSECQGIYNLTAPGAVSNQQFSEKFAAHLGRPCFMRTPAFALKLMFGEMADLLLYGQNVYPQHLMEQGFEFAYPELDEALAHLSQSF